MEQTNAAATTMLSEVEQLRQQIAALQESLQNRNRSAAEYENLLNTSGAALQRVAADGTILWASPGQLNLLGYPADEYIGRHVAEFYDLQRDGVPVREGEFRARCKDGSIRYVTVTATAEYEGGQLHHQSWLSRDLTERRRSELRLSMQFRVSQLLTYFGTISEAAPALLSTIAEYLEFQFGALWVPSTSGELRCETVWHSSDPDIATFAAATESRTFRHGVGLPGRVWDLCAPEWIETVDTDGNFPRRQAARKSGLQSGLAFPIRAGDESLGVIELFSSAIRKTDSQLLDSLGTLGLHIGQFMKRREAELASANHARQLQVLYEMADAVIRAVSVEEIYAQALITLERLLGVERSSILIADTAGVMRFRQWRGISDEYRRAVEGHSAWPPDEKHPEPVLVPNVREAPDLEPYQSLFERENIAGLVFIPLISRTGLIGKLMLYYATPTTLAEHDIALARAIASHVAVAIERKEAEVAMEEQRTRVQLALDAADTGVWEWDIAADRVIWSDRVYEIHGLQPGSISGDPRELSRLFHPDDRDLVRDAVLNALSKRGGYTTEFRILRPTGEVRWIATSGHVVCDERSNPVRLIGTTVDITERKHAEDKLRESADTINALLESAAQAIITADEQGHIISINRMAERMFGYTRGDLAGTKIETLIPERFRQIHVRHRADFHANPRTRPMASGLELTALRKDGTEFPVEVSLSYVEARSGRVSVSFITDISARKQAERALRESEERYRTLFEHSNDALGVSVDEKFAYVNPALARMFGYASAGDLVGAAIYSVVPPSQQQSIRSRRTGRQRERQVQPMIYQAVGLRQDGTEFIIEIRATDYRMNGVLHTLAILRDITAERQAEDALAAQAAALARSNADLQQFAYATSHDLQEPLRNISAYSQLLARRYRAALDGDADQFIENIVSGCRRMEALIKDLLAFSKLTSEETPIFLPVDIGSALGWAEKNLELSVRETGAVITRGELPVVRGDQVQLVQLLQNLLGNALKYRREAPVIEVSAVNSEHEWTFSVKDNGIGIAPEYHERVFGLFKRLHGREIPGTGVGLAICKKIVEKHGGRIWVESVAGSGSTFYFTLPA
jgi:PAS domain S-box-containing protein